MPKKKKTQLKPVARGFATTSQPKKIVLLEDASEDVSGRSSGVEEGSTTCGDKLSGEDLPTHPGFDSSKAEEGSLQHLVEKLQDKTEKEVYMIPLLLFMKLTYDPSGIEDSEGSYHAILVLQANIKFKYTRVLKQIDDSPKDFRSWRCGLV